MMSEEYLVEIDEKGNVVKVPFAPPLATEAEQKCKADSVHAAQNPASQTDQVCKDNSLRVGREGCAQKPFPCRYPDAGQCGHDRATSTDSPKVCTCLCHQRKGRLSQTEANAIEAEMRRLEIDPSTDKRALRLFMQWDMPCGHAAGNLLTCPEPPFGCVLCNRMSFPDCEHRSIGHNDGQCCAVCALSKANNALREALKGIEKLELTDETHDAMYLAGASFAFALCAEKARAATQDTKSAEGGYNSDVTQDGRASSLHSSSANSASTEGVPERIWIDKTALRVGHGYIYLMNPDNADFDYAPVEFARVRADLAGDQGEGAADQQLFNDMEREAMRLTIQELEADRDSLQNLCHHEHIPLATWDGLKQEADSLREQLGKLRRLYKATAETHHYHSDKPHAGDFKECQIPICVAAREAIQGEGDKEDLVKSTDKHEFDPGRIDTGICQHRNTPDSSICGQKWDHRVHKFASTAIGDADGVFYEAGYAHGRAACIEKVRRCVTRRCNQSRVLRKITTLLRGEILERGAIQVTTLNKTITALEAASAALN